MTPPPRAESLDAAAALPHYTGGQYSMLRLVLGLTLMWHMAFLAPRARLLFSNEGWLAGGGTKMIYDLVPNVLTLVDNPVFVTAVLLYAAGLAGLFALGWFDRMAALLIWYVLVCMTWRNPIATEGSMLFLGWLLLAHVLLPPAPYGAVSGRARVDPRGGWYMPRVIFAAHWILLAVAYTASGIERLSNPAWGSGYAMQMALSGPMTRFEFLRDWTMSWPTGVFALLAAVITAAEVASAPLMLSARLRPIAWAWLLVFNQVTINVVMFGQVQFGVLMLHLYCFDPQWIRPRAEGTTDMLFYDGRCGLCHRLVRFILAEDHTGRAFRFAPLDSERFRTSVSPRHPKADSLVVLTQDGAVLTHSTASLHVLRRLGGLWAILADLLIIVPRPLRDVGYRLVASVRHLLFRQPGQACPVLPPELRMRFVE